MIDRISGILTHHGTRKRLVLAQIVNKHNIAHHISTMLTRQVACNPLMKFFKFFACEAIGVALASGQFVIIFIAAII